MKTKTHSAIKAPSDVLDFGRYTGWKVKMVLELAPDYILWLKDENICEVSQDIYDLAVSNELDRRLDGYLDGDSIWDYMAD